MTIEATEPQSSIRLAFDDGTILVEGLAEGDDRGIPGLRFDPRRGVSRRGNSVSGNCRASDRPEDSKS